MNGKTDQSVIPNPSLIADIGIVIKTGDLVNCIWYLKGYQRWVVHLELKREYYTCMPRTKSVFCGDGSSIGIIGFSGHLNKW